MLAFVDESGDPGLKLDRGSSRYFFVVLVVFEDNDEAEAADQRIGLLRRELALHPNYEFRFNRMSRDLRMSFLRALAPYEYLYYGVVINKSRLFGEGFRYKESFYKYVTRMVFNNARPYLRRATVVIDGSGSREFRQSLDRYLRLRMNEEREVIRKVKIQNSNRNNLLQLADMVVGALARSFSSKGDAKDYRELIRRHEVHVQVWPR